MTDRRWIPFFTESLIKDVWQQVRPKRPAVYFSWIASLLLISKLLLVAGPLLLREILNALIDIPSTLTPNIFLLVITYCASRLFSDVAQESKNWTFAPIAAKSGNHSLILMHDQIFTRPLNFWSDHRSGYLTRVMERAAEAFTVLLNQIVFHIGPKALEVILTAVVLWISFDFLPVAILLITILIYIGATIVLTKRRQKIKNETEKIRNELSSIVAENVNNFEIIKALRGNLAADAPLPAAAETYRALQVRWERNLVVINAVQSAVISLGLSVMMLYGWFRVRSGDFSIGDFALINSLFIQISVQLTNVASMYRNVTDSVTELRAGCDLYGNESSTNDPSNRFSPESNAIFLENVSVSYGVKQALNGVTLNLSPNFRLAIVGPTGSGKSTLARVISGLLQPTSGSVLLGNHVLNRSCIEDASFIGIVPQEVTLFNASIESNIRYGRPTASDDEVNVVIDMVRLRALIDGLPEGSSTSVGEKGLKLSGGERQRIALARALLQRPKLLVLDEATSALDNQTERHIKESLAAIRGVSLVVVAHRLNTIVDFDNIVVLDLGGLIGIGTHKELLANCPLYAEMWTTQLAEADAYSAFPA